MQAVIRLHLRCLVYWKLKVSQLQFLETTIPVLKRVALFILSVAALVGIVVIVAAGIVKPETRQALRAAIMGAYPDGRDASWHTPAGEELIRANSEHYYVAFDIAQCFGAIAADFAWRQGPSDRIAIPFMLGLGPNGENTWSGLGEFTNVKLTNYQRSILTLSSAISSARTQLAAAAAANETTRYLLQVSIIIIGALTTILVSIKSIIDKNATYSMQIGILAVVFSAGGTALSSLNSFVGPSESFATAERALIQARQLQLDLGLFVAQQKDICAEFDPDKTVDTRTKRITELSGKLRDILGSGLGGSLPASASEQPGGQVSSPRGKL